MATIQDLANSIAQMEGYNIPGSIANRNNNPGNLRYSPLQVGTVETASGKFATFATPEDGWFALQNYIDSKAVQGVSLRDFIYSYAPPTENDTSGYLNFLSDKLGIGADSSLSDLYGNTNDYVDSFGDSGSFTDTVFNTPEKRYVGLGLGVLLVWLVSR